MNRYSGKTYQKWAVELLTVAIEDGVSLMADHVERLTERNAGGDVVVRCSVIDQSAVELAEKRFAAAIESAALLAGRA